MERAHIKILTKCIETSSSSTVLFERRALQPSTEMKSDAILHFYLSQQINRQTVFSSFSSVALLKFVIAILKSHKLKVIYFICSHFYYFFTAIYFTVFYEDSYISIWNEKRREQPEDSQTINNFFNFIYQWIHISRLSIARGSYSHSSAVAHFWNL